MTTEEMNRVIAEYMGWETNIGYSFMTVPDSADPEVYKHSNYYPNEMLFHKSFDWLMPVWQKLRGELCDMDIYDEYEHEQRMKRIAAIEKAIAQDTDITTAHRLMVEAIELIKK